MNSKVIALIVVIVILVIAGIAIALWMNPNNQEGNNLAQGTENTAAGETVTQANAQDDAQDDAQVNAQDDTQTEEGSKTLIVYFSMSENTQTVANFIHEAIGGDIIRLETEQTYPSDYNELLDVAQEEQSNNARPALKTKIDNINEYDTIFLGYPNWWGDMPMPIYTFLDNYDLSGKTIAPFVTSGGSGFSGTIKTIKEAEPNANVTEGLSINGSSAESSQSSVNEWVSNFGF